MDIGFRRQSDKSRKGQRVLNPKTSRPPATFKKFTVMALTAEQLQNKRKNNSPDPELLIGHIVPAFDPGYHWQIEAYNEKLEKYLLVKKAKSIPMMRPIGAQETKWEHKSEFSAALRKADIKQKIESYES